MKSKQALRKLEQAGVQVVRSRGKGGHVVLLYEGRQTTFPMHGSRETSARSS